MKSIFAFLLGLSLFIFTPSIHAQPFNLINVGASPNDHTGDTLRAAMQKINDNYSITVPTLNGDITNFNIFSNVTYLDINDQTNFFNFTGTNNLWWFDTVFGASPFWLSPNNGYAHALNFDVFGTATVTDPSLPNGVVNIHYLNSIIIPTTNYFNAYLSALTNSLYSSITTTNLTVLGESIVSYPVNTNDSVNIQYLNNSLSFSNYYYVRSGGNNSTALANVLTKPWLTPLSAVNAAVASRAAGNTNFLIVDIGSGVFDLSTNALYATNNFVIQGQGQSSTILLYNGDEHSKGPAIMCVNNLTVKNLTIKCPTNVNADYTCFGALSDSPNNGFSGVSYINDCTLIAGAHGIQLNPTNTLQSSIYSYRCTFQSPNAPAQVLQTNSILYISDFYADATGPEPRSRSFSCGFQNFGGNLILRNGTIHVRSSNTANETYGVTTILSGSAVVTSLTNDLSNIIFDVATPNGSPIHLNDFALGDPTGIYSVSNKITNCRRLDGTPLTFFQTNAPSISGGTFTTNINFVAGTVYSNLFGKPIMIFADAILTEAAVAGRSSLEFQAPGVRTNVCSQLTAVGLLTTGASTNAIAPLTLSNGATWSFVDTSSGAGNSASVHAGQITILP